ncbi:MAG TPA: MlaD family protein [bacterium]|mgnify:CR=1 FL=1|nr:MlaD family protein [bacterium]HPJ71960.1 MlaD family protein [bacterium]HPQ65621.1 MlaD family protein [bacterium]
MAQKFKFRYVNEIVGVFVILVLALLAAGIYFAANAQKWFEPVTKYRVTFPESGSYGLVPGARVEILGTTVGTVPDISVAEDGSMEGKIEIRGDFVRFIRKDSQAVIRKAFVVAGDAYIEITRGKGERLAPDSFIPCRRDKEITETLQSTLEEIQLQARDVMEQARITLKVYAELGEEAGRPDGDIMQLIANLRRISASLAEGEGPAGAVLTDPEMAAQVREMVADLREITGKLKQAAAPLPGMVETISGEVDDAPGTVLQMRDSLDEARRLLEAVQRHWLIRSYVEPNPRDPGLLGPGALDLEESPGDGR